MPPRANRATSLRVVPFVLRYVLLAGAAVMLPAMFPALEQSFIQPTLTSLAAGCALVGLSAGISANAFSVGQTHIAIVPDCTPVLPMLLFASGVLAYPAPWRARLQVLLVGIPVLWLYNMLRIYSLMGIQRFAPAYFDLAHIYLWQSCTMLLIVAGMMLWVRRLHTRGASA